MSTGAARPAVDEEELSELISALTLDDKVALLTGEDTWTLRPITRIGLRKLVMSDGPAGVRGTVWDERDPSCNFPSPTALAASWDPRRVAQLGHGLGSEARRKGVDVVLGPTINLHRSPYGGRHFEALSEDPVLTSVLATALVQAIQAHGVGATLKHYVANESETERFTVDVCVDERALRELYLTAFEGPVVDGGAWLVMSAYNSINGTTATESDLLRVPLKDEWAFDGVVVSDWTAVRSLRSAAAAQDLSMPGPAGPWGDHLVAAVRAGTIAESVIDDKVRRILRLAQRVGALDGAVIERPTPLTSAETRALARTTAVDGMVLLANTGLLPLSSPARIAVIGEGALTARTQGGGSATVVPADVVSPLDGIRERWPDTEVRWALGAVVQEGLTPLPTSSLRTAAGPGIRVRFLDSSGRPIAEETRHSSSLVWFGADTPALAASCIELEFVYEGEGHRLALAGVADYTIVIDHVEIETGSLRPAASDDPAASVLNPPSAPVRHPFPAGEHLVTIRFEPVAGGIPDGRAVRVGTWAHDVDAEHLIAEAVHLAAASDVAVVVVSTTNEVESEGFDRTSLTLPGAQDDLVDRVAAANPNTVVIVNSGAPVVLPWRERVAAAIAVWFPGQEFGAALADVLSGDHEPGGRLPVTWPGAEADVPVACVTPTDGRLAYDEGIHIGDRAWRRVGRMPGYPFGHGLGYTSWDVVDVVLHERADDAPTANVAVRNTGRRRGKCVVQLYAERISPSAVDRPERWLVGFAAVVVDAGSEARVDIEVPWRRFMHWADGAWTIEPGGFSLIAGLSSASTGPSVDFNIEPS